MIGIFEQEGINIAPEATACLTRYLAKPSRPADRFPLPPDSFNPLRNQYDAETLIDRLQQSRSEGFDYRLYIVNVDLYAPRMNFIFGLADQLHNAALVSTYRLAGAELTTRLCKEIVHEIGHLLGLRHCPDHNCVMHFSNTIADTDLKRPELCDPCRRQIEDL